MPARIFIQKFWQLIRWAQHVRLLMWVLVAFVVSSCGGQIKNKQEITGNFGDWDVKIPVSTEAILPKKEVAEPFVFELKDKNGVPISKLPVDVVLVPYDVNADLIDNPTQASLADLWKGAKGSSTVNAETQNSGNAQTTLSDEEIVGRVLKWDTVSKDDGRVSVWLKSPSEFNRKVVILLKVGDAGFEYYTFATYQTTDYTTGAKLGVHFQKYESCEPDASILPENEGLSAVAGECFAIFVKVLEDAVVERIYANYNGSANLVATASPSTSFAQVVPSFLGENFTCQFTNGVCLIPIKAKLASSEAFPIKIRFKEENGNPKAFEGTVTTTSNGKKAGLVLKDSLGAPSGTETAFFNFETAAGETKNLAAVWVDAGGNFLSNASQVIWSVPNNPNINQGFPAGVTTPTIQFQPTKTGTGALTIQSEGKSEFKPISVTVPSGPFVKWGVRVNRSVEQNALNAITAGRCVDIDLFASDAFDNPNSTVNANGVQVVLSIENAQSFPPVADTPHFEGTSLDELQLNNVSIVNGEATGIQRMCLYDATLVAPKLTVRAASLATQFATVTGESQPVVMKKGDPSRLALVFPNANENLIKHACPAFTALKQESIEDPCIVNNLSDSEDMVLRTATMDSAGNFIAYVASKWEQKDPANAPRLNGDTRYQLTNVANTDGEVILSESGTLNIERNKVSFEGDVLEGRNEALNMTVRYSFQIISDTPTSVRADPCVGVNCEFRSSVLSTDKFGMRIKFLDAAGNVVSATLTEDSNDYKRKVSYSTVKPEGLLRVSLTNAQGSLPHPILTSLGEPLVCPHNGAVPYTLSGTTCTLNSGNTFEATLDANTPFVQGSFLIPPTNTMFFQSQRKTESSFPLITGSVDDFSFAGGRFIEQLGVSSGLIAVEPGAPYFFQANENAVTTIDFFDETNSAEKIVIQTNDNPTIGKRLTLVAFDEFGNEIAESIPSNVSWQPDAAQPNCDSGNITSGLVSTDATPTRANTLTEVTEFILNSPCELAGRVQIEPVQNATLNNEFSQISLVKFEFVGNVADRFLIEAVSKQGFAIDGAALETIEAGDEFYLRVIPLTLDGGVASSYTGVKTLSISSPNINTWGGNLLSSLPQSTGELAACNFESQTTFTVQGVSKTNVPVCILRGRQSFIPDVGAQQCNTSFSVNTQIITSTGRACSRDGFIAQGVTGTNVALMRITDFDANTTIRNSDLTINNLFTPVVAGPPTQLLIANKCGGPSQGALPWYEFQQDIDNATSKAVRSHIDPSIASDKEFYEVTTDDQIKLVPVLADSAGNYIRDVVISHTIQNGIRNSISLPQYLVNDLTVVVSTQSASANCTDNFSEITINPTTISDIDSLKALATTNLRKANFDKITLNHNFDSSTVFSESITLAVNSGRPAQAAIETLRVNLADQNLTLAAHTSDSTSPPNKHLSPGDCAELKVTARDQHGNLVIAFAETVDVDLRLVNYNSNTASESFFQPGGLYKGETISGVKKPVPILNTNADWTPSDSALNWAANAEFFASDKTDPRLDLKYVGHERISGKSFSNGVLSNLNRYICVFDLTPGDDNKPFVEAKIGALQGNSEKITLVANSASRIDVRKAGDRLCRLPSGLTTGVMLPRMVKNGAGVSFAMEHALSNQSTESSCLPLEASGTEQVLNFSVVDKVGNNVAGSINTASITLPSTGVTGTLVGSNFGIKTTGQSGLRKTDTIEGQVTGSGMTQHMAFEVLAKQPATFDVCLTGQECTAGSTHNGIISADSPFNLTFVAKDQFGNYINDPDFAHRLTATLTYVGDVNGPNGTSEAAGEAPASISTPLVFTENSTTGKWQASTLSQSPDGMFHFKKSGGAGVVVNIAGLYEKSGTTSTATGSPLTVAVLTGNVASTVITQDTSSAELSTGSPNSLTARSSSLPYFFRTRSFDQFGNVKTTSDSLDVTCNNMSIADVVTCDDIPEQPGRLSISVNKSGTFDMKARLGTIETPVYPMRIAASGTSKVRLTRKDSIADPIPVGSQIKFELTLVDDFDNVSETGSHAYTVEWALPASYPDIAEGGEKVSFDSTDTCTFVESVCAHEFTHTVKGAVENLTDGRVIATVRKTGTSGVFTGSSSFTATPGAIDHYNVAANAAGKQARRDLSNDAKFQIVVTAHDEFGNQIRPEVDTSLQGKQIQLSIQRPEPGVITRHTTADGATRIGNGLIHWKNETDSSLVATASHTTFRDPSTFYSFTASSPELTINNLAYDETGSFKIIAFSGSGSDLITTPLGNSETFNLNASVHSIKEFEIDTPTNLALTAGESKLIRIVARDFYNQPLRGLDDLLSGGTFSLLWNAGLPATNATLPTALSFTDGIANPEIRLEQVLATAPETSRVYTSNFNFTATESTSGITFNSTTKSTSVILSPAALDRYKVEAIHSGNALTSATTLNATLTDVFSLQVTALDAFGNRRQGESGINLVAVKSSDTSLPGAALNETILRKPNGTTFNAGFNAAFSPNALNLVSGTVTLSDVAYLIPQTVQFTLAGTSVPIDPSVSITFNPTVETVHSYAIDITGSELIAQTGLRTHDLIGMSVTARDIDGNAIFGIASALNNNTYAFANAPDAVVTNNDAPAFGTNGVWQTSIQFQHTQNFPVGTLTVTDNQSPSRTGGNQAFFEVNSRFKNYVLDPGGTSVEWSAGSPAQLRIVAVGEDDLPVRNFDVVLNDMNHTFTGLENAPNGTAPTFNNSTNTSPELSFEDGIAFVNITAVKKAALLLNDPTKLNLQDNFADKLSGASNKSGTLKNTVQVRSSALHHYTVAVVGSDSTFTADSAGLFSLQVTPEDAFGNSTQGEIAASLVATHSDNTKTTTKLQSTAAGFNPDSIDLLNGISADGSKTFSNLFYAVPFTNVTFAVVGQDATVNGNSTPTGSISFTPTSNSVARYQLIEPNDFSPVAGESLTITVKGLDVAGNEVTGLDSSNVTALSNLNFKIFGPANAPNGEASSPAVNNSFNITFDENSVGTLAITLKKSETLPIGVFRLEDDFATPRVGTNSVAWTITHAPASTLVTAPQPDVRAGVPLTIEAVLKDAFGNHAACTAGQRGLFAEASFEVSPGTFNNDTTSPGVFTSTTAAAPSFSSGGDTVDVNNSIEPIAANNFEMTLQATLFKKGVNKVTLKACDETIVNDSIVVNVTEALNPAVARISTDANRPANGAEQQEEVECRHSGENLTSANVTCPEIYSYFWDQYGNEHSDGTGLCSWTATKAHSTHDSLVPTVTASSVSLTPSHTGPINANLVCTNGSATASTLLFGGISGWKVSVRPNPSTTHPAESGATNDLSGKPVTVGEALTLENVEALMLKGDNNTLQVYTTTSGTTHEISVNVDDFGGTSNPGVANIPLQLNANLSPSSGATAAGISFSLPFNAGFNSKSLTLTMRGKPLTLSNITVNTGTAVTIAFSSPASTAPLAGDAFTETIHVRDSSGNFANCSSINVSVVGGGTHSAPANGSTIPGEAATFDYDTVATIAHSGLGQFSVPITLYKAESITLLIKTIACVDNDADTDTELTLQKTYNPVPKTDVIHSRLAHLSNPGAANVVHEESSVCAMGSGLNVVCPTVYAHFWDRYGNYLESEECDSWAWHDYDAGSPGAAPTLPTTAGSKRSVGMGVFNSFIDGRLSCSKANAKVARPAADNLDNTDDANSERIHTLVRGGLVGIEVATTQSSTSNTALTSKTFSQLVASANNLNITEIRAKTRVKGVIVDKADFIADSTETITLSTSGASDPSRTLTSGAHPIVVSTTIECEFGNNGVCNTPGTTSPKTVDLNFKVTESQSRTVTLNLRSKQFQLIASQVLPNVAHSATVDVKQSSTLVTSVVAGSQFDIETTVKDEFGNLTDRMNDNVSNACVVGSVTETGSSIGAADSNPSIGLYKHTNKAITVAGVNPLSVQACGLSAVTRSLTVTPAALHEIRITDGTALPAATLEHKQCDLAATGTGANCGTIRAFFLDSHGNERADVCTTWTWTDNGKSQSVYTDMTSPSLSIAENSANTTVTHSDFFDGVLACTTGSISEKIDLYGGIGKVVIANEAALVKEITAGATFDIPTGHIEIRSPARSASTTGSRAPVAAAGDENLVEISDVKFPDSNSQLVTISAPTTIDGSTLPAPANCNFGASGNKGICSTNTYSTTLTKANGSGLTLRVSVRGKSVDIGGITVVPANAHDISGVAFTGTTYNADNEIDEISTDDIFRVRLTVRDAHGNPTNRSHNSSSCTLDATNVTIDTSGVALSPISGKTQDTSLEPTAPADRVLLKAAEVGVYETDNSKQLRLIASGANGATVSSTLKYSLCGKTHTAGITLQVKSGVPNEVFLRTDTNAQRASSATQVECKLNPAGAGATCPTVTAFFYDQYQNQVTGANAVCDTWTMTKTNASNVFALPTVGELVPAANENSKNIPTASATQSFVTSGPLNLKLKCNRAGPKTDDFNENSNANKLELFGGISRLTVDHGNKTIDAAPNNFSISAIKYMTQKGNAEEVMSTTAMSAITANDTIFFTTDASAGATGVQPIANASVSCDFRTNGTCGTTHNFTFNKAELDRKLSVNVRGVTFDITDIDVSPGAVDNTKTIVSNLPDTTTAGTTISGVTVELFDQYQNRTSNSCANNQFTSVGFTLADTNNTALDASNSNSPNNTAPTLPSASEITKDDSVVIGKFTFGNIRFTKANEYRIKGNACGVEVINRDLTVTSGATASIKVFKTVPANPFAGNTENEVECNHSGTGAAVACPQLTATFFDALGNQITGDAAKCTNGWSFAGESDTTTPSIGTGATPNVVNITATDYIDGTVKCTSGAIEGAMPIFGGTKEIELVVSTTTPTAGLNNVTLNHVIVKQRKGDNTVAVLAARTNETISLSTAATKGELANNDVLPANTITCSVAANDSGKCTPTSTTQFNFTRAEAKALTASIRGKAHPVTVTTTAAAANTAELEQDVAGNKVAGTAFDMTFRAFDTFGNTTTTNCSSITGSGGLAAPNGDAAAYSNLSAAGTIYSPSVNLKAAGSHPITFTCNGGISATTNVIVDSATTRGGFIFAATNSRPAFTSTPATLSLGCNLDSGDANNNITCPQIHAFAYDTFGNSHNDNSCTWKITQHGGAALATNDSSLNGSTINSAAAASSAIFKRNTALDAVISCDGINAFNTAHPIVYGGVTDFILAVPNSVTGATLKAANKNAVVTSITAHSKKSGNDVAVPGIADHTMSIAFAISDVANAATDLEIHSTDSCIVDTLQYDCNFNATSSKASNPFEFTLKRVHATNQHQFSFTFKGITKTFTAGRIIGGSAVTLTSNLANTYAVDGNDIAFEIQAKDQFSNNTSLNPSGAECENNMFLTTNNLNGVYNNDLPAANSGYQGQGRYTGNMKLFTAGANVVNISACGLSLTKSIDMTVGTAKRVVITPAIPEQNNGTSFYAAQGIGCATDATLAECERTTPRKFVANADAETGTLYAWHFDVGGNILATQDGSCKAADGDTNVFSALTTENDATAKAPAGSGVTIVQQAAATVGAFTNVIGFKLKSNSTPAKYHWTTVKCTSNKFVAKTHLNLRQPVTQKPSLKCFPFGPTMSNSEGEALCTLSNTTSHTIANTSVQRCNDATGHCAGIEVKTDAIDFTTTFAENCGTNLIANNANNTNSSTCSVYIRVASDKFTLPFYFSFTSPDSDQVVFDKSNVVRIPATWDTAVNACGKTLPSYEAAACDHTPHAGKINPGTEKGYAYNNHVVNNNCSGKDDHDKRITTSFNPRHTPKAINASPTASVLFLDATDGVTIDGDNNNCDGTTNTECTVKFEFTRSASETVVKLVSADGIDSYFVRTGRAPSCAADQ